MNELPMSNPAAIEALERIIQEISYLVDHPRIQQRTWVASGKQWLPLLHIIHNELTGQKLMTKSDKNSDSTENSNSFILVEVNAGQAQTFISVRLTDIQQVEVYRGGEPGHRYIRGAHSGFLLKDGRKYLTTSGEAQRLVDAMRKSDSSVASEQK